MFSSILLTRLSKILPGADDTKSLTAIRQEVCASWNRLLDSFNKSYSLQTSLYLSEIDLTEACSSAEACSKIIHLILSAQSSVRTLPIG